MSEDKTARQIADEMENTFVEIKKFAVDDERISFHYPLDHINRTITKRMWEYGYRLEESATDFVRFIRVDR